MSKNTQVLFRRPPEGLPVPDDFEVVEAPVPEPGEGQILVRGLYLSLDPYMRMLIGGGWQFLGGGMTPGQVMVGRVLGEVVESRDPDVAPGDRVVGRLGWQEYAVADPAGLDFRVEPREGVPPTAWLGACGSNGTTAWVGLKLIGEPREGETVLVSAAAGSVGSAVGQLAGAWGCRAVGIAGGPEKCRIVTGEFGFDACCDYKAQDLAGRIARAAPDGVDAYFDNVGAETLDAVLPLLNPHARVPVCGVLSTYNAAGEPPAVRNTRLVFDKRLKLQGFLNGEHRDRWDEARAELEALVASGRLRYRETVAEGLTSAPEAFIGMLRGANVGKQLVRLG